MVIFKCYFMPKRRQKEAKISRATAKAKRVIVDESAVDNDQEKIFLLKVGVACIMVVLVVAWIFNLKYQFKINSNSSGQSTFNWEQTKAELDKAMVQVKEGLNQINQAREQAQNTLPREPELTAQQIDLLKGKLLNEAATSTTASSTKK
jgi:hypothetical protein